MLDLMRGNKQTVGIEDAGRAFVRLHGRRRMRECILAHGKVTISTPCRVPILKTKVVPNLGYFYGFNKGGLVRFGHS